MLLRQPRSNLRPCAHTIYMSVIGLRYRSAVLMDTLALEVPIEKGSMGGQGKVERVLGSGTHLRRGWRRCLAEMAAQVIGSRCGTGRKVTGRYACK